MCLLPWYSAVNGSFVSVMCFLLWQEILISGDLSGVLLLVFLEACSLISIFYKPSSPVQLWDQKTPTRSVLAILTAEAHRNGDYSYCKSDIITGSTGIRNDHLNYRHVFWTSVEALGLCCSSFGCNPCCFVNTVVILFYPLTRWEKTAQGKHWP